MACPSSSTPPRCAFYLHPTLQSTPPTTPTPPTPNPLPTLTQNTLQTYSEAALAAGYPLAATTVQQVEWWMERLVASAALRQEVAALGLRAAAAYSMEGTAARYEHAFCPYASGASREQVAASPPRSVYNALV